MKEGDVRIIKADSRNYGIEVCKQITNRDTKETRLEWVEAGYFGHRFDHVARHALFQALPEGPLLADSFDRALARIEVLGAKKEEGA